MNNNNSVCVHWISKGLCDLNKGSAEVVLSFLSESKWKEIIGEKKNESDKDNAKLFFFFFSFFFN